MSSGCCSSGSIRTPELGPSTSGTGSFQNLTGLPEGTNVRKRKSREVSIQQTITIATQRSSKIAAKGAISNFVTPRKRVKKPKVISTCDTVMFLDTAELSLMVVCTQHMHNVLLLQALVALLIIKIIVVMSRRSQLSI